MGVVALATDPELGRRVALKLIRRELVEGKQASEELRQRFAIEQRLALVRKVCAGLEYAHRSLVVHRDLKPGNILVTAAGEPRLLDFGIAKELAAPSDRPAPEPPRTRTGRQPLTLAYASPEQVRGRAITTASDVYALGVVVYELLCGHPPYVLDGDWLENARTICEEEPSPPSSRTGVAREVWKDGLPSLIPPQEIARVRGEEPFGRRWGNPLRRRLRGDLDSIVLKALAKDPERRYRSMEQFSEDLRRHLEGHPVRAHRATFGYRTGKFLLRNRWRMTAAGLIAAVVFTAAAMRVGHAREIERMAAAERRAAAEAQAAEGQAESLSGFMRNLLRASDPDVTGGKPLTAREILDRAEHRVRQDLLDEPEMLAHQLEAIGLAH